MRSVSQESIKAMREADKVVIISRFPIDEYNCVCQNIIRAHMKNVAKMNEKARLQWYERNTPFQCPRAKNQKLFNLKCQNCGEIIAWVNAMNSALKNWSNLHYISWYNKEGWRGTYGVNINPYLKDIRIECCCSENKSFKSYKIEEI